MADNDYIKREDAKDIIRGTLSIDTDADKDYVCSLIDAIPPVEPQRGEWVFVEDEFMFYRCSNCNELNDLKTAFCPYCGTRMVGERDAE